MGRDGQLNGKDYAAIGRHYAEQVVREEIPAGKLARLACQRQLDDLGRSDLAFRFDEGRANRVCKFIENLPHIKGRWKSKTITLEPWQCFLLVVLFGWVDDEGFRRFRTAYIEVPRKNAKTTICAGIALFMLCADGEPGAEVYSAAVTRDQARISWEIAREMVKREPEMQEYFGVEALAHSIVRAEDASSFTPLARDADSLEGKSPHCAIVDEVHAHKTREVWDVLNVARGSRRQSLLLGITTAGENKTGICYEQHNYIEQILTGRYEDDRYFGIIYTIDPEDDWTSEDAARKANPNYGVSVLADDIQTMSRQAQANAESQNNFLTKRLNVWVSVGTAFFNLLAWDTICKDESLKIEDFYGEPCVITLDLATKRDLTSKVAVFKRGPVYYAFGTHYLPTDRIEHGVANYDFYRGWAREGKLTLTEGNITDYEFIERDVLSDMANLKPTHVGVDPNYNAGQLTTRLQAAGVPMQDVPQTVMNLSEPMKELEALIVAGRVKHNGDPVLAWAMGNVVAKRDAKDNVYPRKSRDENKIDPAVALIGNIGLHLRMTKTENWDFKILAL
jgi:phage terminase large subunit-like protein